MKQLSTDSVFRLASRFTTAAVIASALVLTLTVSGCSKSAGSGDGKEGSADGSVQDLELANQQRFGSGNIPKGESDGAYPDIHFGYDSSSVDQADYDSIKKLADALNQDKGIHAEIEGHCDKRGTNEYNMALGQQRARAVAKVLASFGVNSGQLSTISYGKEIPLDPRDAEDAYAKNRRAHFALYKKDGNTVQ